MIVEKMTLIIGMLLIAGALSIPLGVKAIKEAESEQEQCRQSRLATSIVLFFCLVGLGVDILLAYNRT